MNNRYFLSSLLVTSVCCILLSTVALAQDLPDPVAPLLTRTADVVHGGLVGRLLKRHKKRTKTNKEKKQVEEDTDIEEVTVVNGEDYVAGIETDETNTNVAYDFNSLSCASIIAIDAFRPRSLDDSGNTGSSFDYYPDSDAIVPYEFSSGVDTDEGFLCELSSGDVVVIKGTDEQYEEMRQMLNNGTLVSAVSRIEMEVENVAPIVTAEGIPTSSSVDDIVATLPSGGIKLIDNTGDTGTRRRLNAFEGDKLVLIVRVTDVDGRSVPEDAYTISDKFFGTYGDTVTVKSGFEACSFGKMQITSDYGTNMYDSKLSAPGVLDVTIDISLTSSTQSVILNAAANAAMRKMGVSLPGPFAHVILVLEGCYGSDQECNFAAYGYVNHWLLVTLGDNWQYPAVIMHEMGHNLDMAHSGGLDGGSYSDHTCLMGNPLFEDNVGKMCFNPVKNFQIAKQQGWYTADTDIAYFNSGIMGGTSWRGRLIGVADYDNNPSNYPIILKLETGGGSDYFVSFNRDSGVNSEVQQASDQVPIYQVAGGDGMTYSKSILKAALREGRSATVENWRKSGLDLTIKVIEINTWSSPAYADVEVLFGTQGMAYMQTSAATMTSTTSTSSTVIFDSGTTESKRWTGSIAALNENDDRESSNNNYPIFVHLYTGDTHTWYITYKEGGVYLKTKDSSGYVSMKGMLEQGQSETVSNWRNSGHDLSIVVSKKSDDYASIEITFRP
ncbi:hypothetical protein ACHAW5_009273 [Stephanodiscus triporus]|uniref:Peptidase M11 gametolysin domain-containing protein n=1 Tax=Stephanodiscus triporus TaxID=2934178 RepID=A0ABD3N254_9STRA